MVDDKLAQEEAQRSANYEVLKSDVKSDVTSEIAARADQTTAPEAQRMENIAGDMRGKAMDEIVQTDREVERGRFAARVSQIVDYIFYVIYGLLTIRLILLLFAANQKAGFFQLINSLTDPLYAPFRGITHSPSIDGGYTLALPIVIAIVVYFLVHMAINGILRIMAHRKTEI